MKSFERGEHMLSNQERTVRQVASESAQVDLQPRAFSLLQDDKVRRGARSTILATGFVQNTCPCGECPVLHAATLLS